MCHELSTEHGEYGDFHSFTICEHVTFMSLLCCICGMQKVLYINEYTYVCIHVHDTYMQMILFNQ
jgi:hypothetical protein